MARNSDVPADAVVALWCRELGTLLEMGVPVLSALEVTARHVDETYDPDDALALLASTGTLRARLFERAMPGRTFVKPTDVEQADVVMRAVYGPDGVKTVGVDAGMRERMGTYGAELAGRGARAVVAGCTEFSVLFAGVALELTLVDPMTLLAEEAVRTARE